MDISDGERPFGIAALNEMKWYMTSNHDSCWRSDGVDSPLSNIRNDMVTELADDNITNENLHWHVTIAGLGSNIEYVSADIVADKDANEARTRGRYIDDHMKKPINIKEFNNEKI